jgi:hypothetical protein
MSQSMDALLHYQAPWSIHLLPSGGIGGRSEHCTDGMALNADGIASREPPPADEEFPQTCRPKKA